MTTLFWILVGAVLVFIGYKAVEMNSKPSAPTNDNVGGGGGSTGTNPDIAGELPKDNKK